LRIVNVRAWLKTNRGLLVFLVCFGFFRTAVADWNPIPSSSMRPTLLEGDVVLVNRLAFDLKVPLTDIRVARLGSFSAAARVSNVPRFLRLPVFASTLRE